MRICKLCVSDIKQLNNILTSATPYISPYPDYIYWFICEYYPEYIYIAKENEQIIGFICSIPIESSKKGIFILQIFTNPMYRKRKIATHLLKSLTAKYKNYGEYFLEFSINPNNVASLNLFKNFAKVNNTTVLPTKRVFNFSILENVYKIELKP